MNNHIILSMEAIEDERLSPYDIRILCYLIKETNQGNKKIKRRQIEEALKISKATYLRSRERLTKYGYVDYEVNEEGGPTYVKVLKGGVISG